MCDEAGRELIVTHRASGAWSLLSAQLDLDRPDAPELGHVAAWMYDIILSRLGPRSPVRFWNFIPSILAEAGDGLDRYRAFNIGRHEALARAIGSQAFARALPTATGIGHDDSTLVVHCLAWRGEHVVIENPRQRPAYQYSERFGPASPSFARGTMIQRDGARELIIGGTASVLGEESVHLEDIEAQLEETLANLISLIEHASGGANGVDPLSRLRSVRVYYVRPGDRACIESRLSQVLPEHAKVEFLRAVICRPELLVEIEGLALIEAGAGG